MISLSSVKKNKWKIVLFSVRNSNSVLRKHNLPVNPQEHVTNESYFNWRPGAKCSWFDDVWQICNELKRITAEPIIDSWCETTRTAWVWADQLFFQIAVSSVCSIRKGVYKPSIIWIHGICSDLLVHGPNMHNDLIWSRTL